MNRTNDGHRQGTALALILCCLLFALGPTLHEHAGPAETASRTSLTMAPDDAQAPCPACLGSRVYSADLLRPTDLELPTVDIARVAAAPQAIPEPPTPTGQSPRAPPTSIEA